MKPQAKPLTCKVIYAEKDDPAAVERIIKILAGNPELWAAYLEKNGLDPANPRYWEEVGLKPKPKAPK